MPTLQDFKDQGRDYLRPDEVAALFRVDPKTVTRWAKAEKISFIRTLGGHRRYPIEEVERLLNARRYNRHEASS